MVNFSLLSVFLRMVILSPFDFLGSSLVSSFVCAEAETVTDNASRAMSKNLLFIMVSFCCTKLLVDQM